MCGIQLLIKPYSGWCESLSIISVLGCSIFFSTGVTRKKRDLSASNNSNNKIALLLPWNFQMQTKKKKTIKRHDIQTVFVLKKTVNFWPIIVLCHRVYGIVVQNSLIKCCWISELVCNCLWMHLFRMAAKEA